MDSTKHYGCLNIGSSPILTTTMIGTVPVIYSRYKINDMNNEMCFVVKINGQYLILTAGQYEQWLGGVLPTEPI